MHKLVPGTEPLLSSVEKANPQAHQFPLEERCIITLEKGPLCHSRVVPNTISQHVVRESYTLFPISLNSHCETAQPFGVCLGARFWRVPDGREF